MTQQQAREWGTKAAGQWLFKGTVSGKSIARQGRGALSAVFRFCRELQKQKHTGPAANWLLDQLWLLRRESEQAAEAVRGAGRLPAIPHQGRCARVQQLGEALAESELRDREGLLEALEAIQQVSPLREEELSILLPCLTLGILHRIRTLTEHWQDSEDAAAVLKDCFDRLRLYSGRDWSRELEGLSVIHQAFLGDEVYTQMDPRGRMGYRRRLAKLARRNRLTQKEQAQAIAEQAKKEGKHLGFALFPPKNYNGTWYPVLVLALSAALTVLAAWAGGRWWVALLALLPASELAKQAVDWAALHMVPRRQVFRLELKEGIPREGKTLCVICALLSHERAAEELCGKLERCWLSNRFAGENVSYGLLADLPDARTEPTAEERQWIAQAKEGVEQLNSRYGDRFFLFTREPKYVSSDDLYRGWERKRGALMELMGLLRGAPTGVNIAAGTQARLTGTAFLLTLDSDTVPGVDSIRALAGTLLHPLNRAVVDEHRRVVTQGYGLLQPKVVTALGEANASAFAGIFCGPAGSDPYTTCAAELYHDLFNRCSYCGKGMIDVEAAAQCLTGRFPENRILSHDLLEGAFLHAGAAEAEVSDGFPASVKSYYRRQHRWVRGDWQAAEWICQKVPNQAGKKEKNPLSAIDRWKLLDNLRRSLLPEALLVCLGAGALVPGKAFRFSAWAALVALAAPLLLSGAELSLRRFRGCGQRTFFPTYDGFSGAVLRLCLQFLLLPVEAWTNGSAMLTALWRMNVSHRGLLEWTVSGQEQAKTWFWVPNLTAGVLLLLLAPHPLGKALGALWMAAPLVLEKLSQQKKKTESAFDQRERAFLRHQAGKIWQYFDTWLRPEDHWLPPDNVQERPSVGAARRTSPTNIGLALLSCLAACDLELTGRERALELIAHQLDTIEQLEKWQGHLYNWYDTETAEPLFPRYVSTVDSGNLCGALLALETGLQELEQPELAQRAAKLAEKMRFRPLYDPERELFYIGWDAEENAFTDSCYDLLASEARQTSFLAVARGEVPVRHWQRLSRVMTSQHRRFGLASWSGTMFEYFMPHLLLPAEERSLLAESLQFCAWVQRGWGQRLGLPWGVSESAFYQLDQGQNYQYKAHGVPPLGLRRGLEQERVAAPYASFLALSALPHSAVKNLRTLAALGAEGRYGLYEAVDFTPARTGGQAAVVRSWMVHHLGMSLLAIDNALNQNPMQRRFMARPEMQAHRLLLQERLPLGLVPPKTLNLRLKRTKTDKIKGYQRAGQGFDLARPACHPLAAGDLLLPLTAEGGGALQKEALLLTEGAELSFTSDNRRRRLAPSGAGGRELQWRFSGNQAEVSLKHPECSVQHRYTLDETGLLQTLCLETQRAGTLELTITPVLDQRADYEAHRAFSRLGLGTETLPRGVCVTRRPRAGRPVPALVLLWEGDASLTVTEECVLQLKVPVSPGTTRLSWALTAGDREEAFYAAQGLLMGMTTGAADTFSALCARYGLRDRERQQLDELTSRLLFPGKGQGVPKGQPALWPYAISGDVPIWAVSGADAGTGERCIRQWAVLQGCGLPFDLVLLCQQKELPSLGQVCEQLSLAHRIGGTGGVHLVEAVGEAAETVTGMAAFAGLPGVPENRFDCPPEPPEEIVSGGTPHWRWEGDEFVMETNGGLLPRRWSQVLTNGRFGWTADDCGTGHLWSGNAHENKLTPWNNAPYAHSGPEQLYLEENGQKISLFAAEDGVSTVIRYGPGFAQWSKAREGQSVSLTAFVPPEGAQRIFLIETSGFSGDTVLHWKAELQMGPRQRDSRFVRMQAVQGQIVAENPANTDFPGEKLTFGASVPLQLEEAPKPSLMAAQLPVGQELVLWAGTGEPLCGSAAEARGLLEQTKEFWRRQAGFLTVDTPDPALNHYLSFWGRYQTIACRLMARSALYQCGGAYGFRDQLQDACGLLPNHPELVREQILRCCRHQYTQGDVQHWWHPLAAEERGVRTRISDDLLWLPWAVCRWVNVTGDRTLLTEQVGWLTSKPLQKGEHNRYEPAVPSGDTGTVFEHCIRAIECCMGRGAGVHGLLLMGTGDWNDGMDCLGAGGRGESVWLTWFAALVLKEFAVLCRPERRKRYENLSQQLAAQAEQAWDGGWYRRAYDDEGRPIGSRESRDCQMDSIAQSFAVFAPNPDKTHGKAAVQAAIQRLYDPKTGTVALLTPPFAAGTGAGYISAYPEGVRENGGQYTHAAVWLAMAALRLGDGEQGWTLLRTLLPEHLDNGVYQGEPYVLAGDVSTAPGKEGRAGWTWYTGAASWYCRAAAEELLGLKVRKNRLYVEPRLPQRWPGYEAEWRLGQAQLHICVRRGSTPSLTVNGVPAEQGIPLNGLSGRADIQVTI